jgi:nicotinate-nucleotide adenylyltransferase
LIAVFGGSFNPVTLAHKKIVDRLKKIDKVTKIIVVPVSRNYEKESLGNNSNHRVEMLKLVMDEDVIISDYEISKSYQVKSFETLSYFKSLYNDEVALVIGSDNLEQFDSWFKPRELLQNFKLIVINRQSDLEKIINANQDLIDYKNSIIEINDLNLRISSTRAKIIKSSLYLDPKVIKYIKLNDLYKYFVIKCIYNKIKGEIINENRYWK